MPHTSEQSVDTEAAWQLVYDQAHQQYEEYLTAKSASDIATLQDLAARSDGRNTPVAYNPQPLELVVSPDD